MCLKMHKYGSNTKVKKFKIYKKYVLKNISSCHLMSCSERKKKLGDSGQSREQSDVRGWDLDSVWFREESGKEKEGDTS